MGFEVFFTLPVSNTSSPTRPGPEQNASSGAAGFIEFIMGLIKSNEETENSPKQLQPDVKIASDKTPLQSDNPALDKNPSLALTATLAANPEIRRGIEALKANGTLSKETLGKILELLQTNDQNPASKDFLAVFPERGEFLNALANEKDITNENGEIQKNLLVKKIQSILNTLALGSDRIDSTQGLIIEGMTPEQLGDMRTKIAALIASPGEDSNLAIDTLSPEEQKLAYDALSAFVGALQSQSIKPLPSTGGPIQSSDINIPVVMDEAAVLPDMLQDTSQDIAQSLNDISIGEDTQKSKNSDPFFIPLSDKKTGEMIARDADAMIEALGNSKNTNESSKSAEIQNTLNVKSAASKNTQSFNNLGFAPIAGFLAPLEDSLGFANMPGTDSTASSLIAAQYAPGSSGRSVNIPSAMSGAHPATQMVAVTLQKSANDQQNRNFILQLDPPELGRVEVRLNFTKEKSLKTVLMTERSDTLALLQKDSQFLERVLQNSGLEMDGSSLSFEMAPDGYFNEGNQGNGNGGLKNSPDISDGLTDIKPGERMTWFVDPQSGTLRYNILA